MDLRRALIIALAVGLFFGIYATIPTAPLGKDAPAQTFSAGRAMDDVRTIAARPHPTGSAENDVVRAYLQQRLSSLGMEVRIDQAPVSAAALERLNTWSGRGDKAVTLRNVIGILPGRDRSLPAVLLMAHHDTVWGSPGAADDTAGVAACLEVVRAIGASGQPERDLIVLITDGEELGLEGAKHFFAANPLHNRVGAIINLEARGGGGRANMFQTSRDNGAAMALYAAAVRRPATSSLAAFIYSVLPNDTDLTPALKGNHTAYNLAFIGRSGLYHSPLITPDRLDQGSLQDIGDQTLDLTAALLPVHGMPGKAPDRVFFDALGLVTVHYSVGLGWLIVAAAIACFAWTLRRDGMRGFGEGVLRLAALVAVAGLLTYALNWVSLGGAAGEYYDRLAALPRLEVIAALACLGAFAAVLGPWRPPSGGIVGFATPLLIAGIAGQAMAPTAIYFVALPLLLVALALALPEGLPRTIGLMAAAMAVVSHMVPLGHFVMQGVGTGMPFAAVLPFTLAAMAILPLWQAIAPRQARLAAGAAIAVALALSLWVQLDAPAATRAVYADNKH